MRTLSEIESVHLAAISDKNKKLGEETAQKYGVAFYEDFEEMLKKEKLDMVSVCVPTSLHHRVAKKCLESKTHVLLEKPITMSLREASSLLQTASKMKVKFLVGHIERHNPAVKKVKEMIDAGDLGKVIAVMARRVGGFPPQIKDADIAVDLAIHDIDIVNYLLNAKPVEMHLSKRRNHIRDREDSVEFFLKYKDASAYIQANWITPVKIRKLNITGTKGYLEMDYINQKIEFYKTNYEKFLEKTEDFSDYILKFSEPDKIDISVAKKEPLKEEILYFLDCISHGKKIDCGYAVDALRVALSK